MLRCWEWERYFDNVVESGFVRYALSSNKLTILEREYGRVGAGEAIRRQQPLLAALLSGDGS